MSDDSTCPREATLQSVSQSACLPAHLGCCNAGAEKAGRFVTLWRGDSRLLKFDAQRLTVKLGKAGHRFNTPAVVISRIVEY